MYVNRIQLLHRGKNMKRSNKVILAACLLTVVMSVMPMGKWFFVEPEDQNLDDVCMGDLVGRMSTLDQELFYFALASSKNSRQSKLGIAGLQELAHREPEAQYKLACLYEEKGSANPALYDRAFNYYVQASNNGHALASLRLGDWCWEISQCKNAKEYYRLGAGQGSLLAAYKLGCLYAQEGPWQNPHEACRWLRLPAQQGWKKAIVMLREMKKIHPRKRK